MSTHTPGPWYAEFVKECGENVGHWEIVAQLPAGLNPANGPYVIADTLNCHHCIEHHTYGMKTEEKANAILLAAAPDLLAALKTLLDATDYTNKSCRPTEMIGACLPVDLLLKARDAIAKAEGNPKRAV